ncbi:MAG: hypothetical protein WDM91_12820 [Rhizomicrobium sp.]
MLRQQRIARKAAARAASRRASDDMALAATIAFFGVFPLVMAGGLLLVQVIGAAVR